VVAALPQGLETMLTERGVNLSGGQKQRLALARGIVASQSSSVLLLDEPTSSLDALTEAHVFSELRSAVPHACIIASVHRLNLLPRFDRVMLMDEGSVLDCGTVVELLERQPLFRELWHRSISTPEANTRAA
jgi:ABC-type multidrug transport system fused ATPase/permease subunit